MSNPRMRREAQNIISKMDHESRDILRHTRIDLDAFLALRGEARAARWRMWDQTAKIDAVIQQLTRNGVDWTDELVADWVARYDTKYGAVPASDLAIPSATEIADAAKEQEDQAERHGDHPGAGQLVRVRLNVMQGARLAWHQGDLLIASLNTPGQVYAVNRRGCSCPNGRARKTSCWHVALFDLLLDLRQRAADAADLAALRDRIAAARRAYLGAA